MAKPWDNENYKIDKPDKKTRIVQEMLLMHQYTFIGAPHIWYGDEIGMWGSDDPCTRKPMVWTDIEYEDETAHPFNKERKTDKVEQDTVLLNFYKKLISIRKANPALIYGDIVFSLVDDENRTLAYNRKYESNEIVVAFNKSESVKLLHIPVSNDGSYKDALNNKKIYVSENGFLNIELESTKAIILIHED